MYVGSEPAVQHISTRTAATGRFPFSGRIQTRKANFFPCKCEIYTGKRRSMQPAKPNKCTHPHTHTLAFCMEKTLKTASLALGSRYLAISIDIFIFCLKPCFDQTLSPHSICLILNVIFTEGCVWCCGGAITF